MLYNVDKKGVLLEFLFSLACHNDTLTYIKNSVFQHKAFENVSTLFKIFGVTCVKCFEIVLNNLGRVKVLSNRKRAQFFNKLRRG